MSRTVQEYHNAFAELRRKAIFVVKMHPDDIRHLQKAVWPHFNPQRHNGQQPLSFGGIEIIEDETAPKLPH